MTLKSISFVQQLPKKKIAKSENRFMLMSMATSASGSQIEASAELYFLNKILPQSKKDSILKKCCQEYPAVPLDNTWCPAKLRDLSYLNNYFKQCSLSQGDSENLDFPNAIYIDAIGPDGTITVGEDDDANRDRGFAYVAALLRANLRHRTTCSLDVTEMRSSRSRIDSLCSSLWSDLDALYKRYPLSLYNNSRTGRMSNVCSNLQMTP